mmetsp:Transcript_8075/g.29571  ORF Transcript_8075/g.29571 Transcript_8075/m.29571 type:complete len:85 (-) Transcript_8075:2696-2950(-)
MASSGDYSSCSHSRILCAANFEDFNEKASALFHVDPGRVRYILKYRHAEGHVVLKITNSVMCVMYVMKKTSDLTKIELLSSLFL